MNPFEASDKRKQRSPLSDEEVNARLRKVREQNEYVRSWKEIYPTQELRADYYRGKRRKIDNLLGQLDELVKNSNDKRKADKSPEADGIWKQIREIQENLSLLQRFF